MTESGEQSGLERYQRLDDFVLLKHKIQVLDRLKTEKGKLNLFGLFKPYGLSLGKILDETLDFRCILFDNTVEIAILKPFIKLLPKHDLLCNQGNHRNVMPLTIHTRHRGLFLAGVWTLLIYQLHKSQEKQL